MIHVNDLVNVFSKIPGVGKKSASRMALYLMKNREVALEISQQIQTVISNIITCSLCGSFTTTDPCEICQSTNRSRSILCVIEDFRDLQAIEETGFYNGQYHILMGVINPLDGMTPDKLRIKELINRINTNKFEEILIATNPTTEGEATFLYLSQILSDYDLKISRFATGIPMGGSLEYSNTLTLGKALQGKYYLKKKNNN